MVFLLLAHLLPLLLLAHLQPSLFQHSIILVFCLAEKFSIIVVFPLVFVELAELELELVVVFVQAPFFQRLRSAVVFFVIVVQ